MLAAVLSIGTELTRGEIVNTNCSWLCEQLTALGVQVQVTETVSDDPADIGAALKRLGGSRDLVVATGGLGPTTDDMTAAAVAVQLGTPLTTDSTSLERISARLARSGKTLSGSNAKQADLPRGCKVLNNDWGTAPGFCVAAYRSTAFFLPGMPREMRPMFQANVVPYVKSKGRRGSHQVRLKTFGAPESQVNDALHGIEDQFGVTVGYRATFPTIEVKTLAFRDAPGEAEAAARAAAAEVKARLGSLVFSDDGKELVEVVADQLRTHGYSLGLAESCTGGLVAALVTQHAASDYFLGAVVSYDNKIKSTLLGVSEQILESEGAVSEAVVHQMAQGAQQAFGCDVALAISGIAGPTGGTAEKPVGLVHFAVATPSAAVARRQVFNGDRRQVQLRAAYAGLNLIRELLT